MSRIIYILPLLTLAWLSYMHYQKFYIDRVPEFISRTTPDFDLPEVSPSGIKQSRMRNADLPKRPVLLNVFASWCSTCVVENRRLRVLSEKHNIPIYGIAYRDSEIDIQRFLSGIGNPYTRVALDKTGHDILKWNLSGLPHTLLIDAKGDIRYHHKGLMHYRDIDEVIIPLVKRLETE